MGGVMKVGDLVVSKNRYRGQYFIVLKMINNNDYDKRALIKCFNGSVQTRWCDAATWEVVNEN